MGGGGNSQMWFRIQWGQGYNLIGRSCLVAGAFGVQNSERPAKGEEPKIRGVQDFSILAT